MDHVELQFLFGQLPESVRCAILENTDPQYSFVCYKGEHLHFQDTSEKIIPDDQTPMWLQIYGGVEPRLPSWMVGVEAGIELNDRFFGYLDNGLFRHGAVKATISTQADRVDNTDYNQQVLMTSVEVRGRGESKRLLKQAIVFYRIIRAGKLDDRHVIERWPVGVPEGMDWVVLGKGKQAERVGA